MARSLQTLYAPAVGLKSCPGPIGHTRTRKQLFGPGKEEQQEGWPPCLVRQGRLLGRAFMVVWSIPNVPPIITNQAAKFLLPLLSVGNYPVAAGHLSVFLETRLWQAVFERTAGYDCLPMGRCKSDLEALLCSRCLLWTVGLFGRWRAPE